MCRKWFEVTQLNKFNRKISLLVASFNPLVDTDWSPILNYKDSLRTEWPNIIISNMEIEVVPKFLEDFGSSVRELVLDKCQINEKTFYGIIPQLNNLELLDICNCPDLFMYGFMNKNYDKSTMIIETLQVLKLRNNSYISDATFCNIMTLAPNIHTLDLSGSCLNFHTALYKKYYPSHIKELSVNVFNYKFVIDFIMKEASKLKQLNLSNTLLNGDALIQLGTVNNLQIETISLNCCAQLTNHGVINFVEQQRNLQHLDVSNITRLTDIGLIQICTILTQLKSLKLKRCRAITNIGLEKLVDLRQLEYLDISECSGINGDGITNGIGKEVHNKLREFHAGCTLLCNRAVKAIAVNFLNLRVLNLTSCRGVTDTTIQLIFVNLIYLRELYVDYCEFVTDASLMGIQLNEQSTNNSSLETNSNAVSIMNPSNPFRIPLGSRAENDITREATRKRIFDEMLLKGECDSISGVSIANLRGLHHLSLSYCKHITNVSLEYSLRFSELKSLNLKSCEEVIRILYGKVLLKINS